MAASLEIRLQDEDVEQMSQRLAQLPDLRLPHSMMQQHREQLQQEEAGGGSRADAARFAAARQHLQVLLRKDPAVFLERYGTLLSQHELSTFVPLRDDYEVNFWLARAEQRQRAAQQQQQQHPVGAKGAAASYVGMDSEAAAAATRVPGPEVRRRRQAYLETVLLVPSSDYFGDDAMHGRAPWLYEQYRGGAPERIAPSPGGSAGGPAGGGPEGGMLAGWFLGQQDRMQTQARLRREQQAPRNFDENESESESEEEVEDNVAQEETEEEEEPGQHGGSAAAAAGPSKGGSGGGGSGGGGVGTPQRRRAVAGGVSGGSDGGGDGGGGGDREEAGRLRGELLELMKQRFLSGQDFEFVDYSSIDADARLDDHWAEQERRDAEDSYFDGDD